MLGIVRGATVPARCASSMVMGEAMGTVTVVPTEFVKLMALMVTAASSTESEGVSPMLMRTAVVEGVGVGVGVVPEPPLLHPVMPVVASVMERSVNAAKAAALECCMVIPLIIVEMQRVRGASGRVPVYSAVRLFLLGTTGIVR